MDAEAANPARVRAVQSDAAASRPAARVDRTMATIALRPAEYNALRVRATIATRPDPPVRVQERRPRHGNPAGLSGDGGSRQSGSGHRHQHWRFATGFRYSGTAGRPAAAVRPRGGTQPSPAASLPGAASGRRGCAGAQSTSAPNSRRGVVPAPRGRSTRTCNWSGFRPAASEMPSITNSSPAKSPSQASQGSP